MRAHILVLGLALAFLGLADARAEDWSATVGARLRIKPPYEGAESHIIGLIPVLVVKPAGQPYRFTPPDGSAALALIDNDTWVAGPVLRFRDSRSDVGRYSGLERIAVATEPGVFVSYWPAGWFRARIEARRGISGHHGWASDASLDLVHTHVEARGERWDYSIGPRVGWGDARYMRTYFGVTAKEAAVRHETPYAPASGLRYTGAAAAAAYHLDRRWTANFDVGYNRLGSKPQSSPVVQSVGAGGQFSAGVGMTYSFGFRL